LLRVPLVRHTRPPASTLFPYTTLFRSFDGVIHSAAVSDYLAGGVYSPADGSRFRPEDGHWLPGVGGLVLLEDRAAGKVKSDEPEDRKSTRLNSSHEWISYAVFCLKKKK